PDADRAHAGAAAPWAARAAARARAGAPGGAGARRARTAGAPLLGGGGRAHPLSGTLLPGARRRAPGRARVPAACPAGADARRELLARPRRQLRDALQPARY